LAPSWEKAAKALKGVVRVGAIDVDNYKNIGGKFMSRIANYKVLWFE